jgi:hypothetical protein
MREYEHGATLVTMSEPHQQQPPVPPYAHSNHTPVGAPGQPVWPQGAPMQPAPFPGPAPGSIQPPSPNSTSSAAAPTGANPLGRVAFILALVAVGIALLLTLSFPFLVRSGNGGFLINLTNTVGNFIVFAVAVAALVLGLLAVKRSSQPILAGVAIGIAVSEVAGIVFFWASTLLYPFAY